MTTLPVDIQHKDALSRQGYAISEWIGFAEHEIPFYAHHPVSDKQVGDVVWKLRVGNPKTLNNAEANTIAKQAHNGYFMWKPDAECMKHTFKDIILKKRPGGGEERIVSEPYMGCRWCRERAGPLSVLTPPAEPVAEVPPLVAAPPPAPPIPSFDVLHCKSCPEVFVGPNALNERRGHLMRKHRKSTAAVNSAASDKDSGKE